MAIIKAIEEIVYAFEEKIGCIVVDNFFEIDMIKEIAEATKARNECLNSCNTGN